MRLLIERELWGLYNMVCEGVTSRLDVATEMLNMLGLQEKVRINHVGSGYFKKEYFAPRPESERLINRKLDLRNCNRMRVCRSALREYLTTYYGDYL